jgi:hypothetical protein
MYGRFALAAGAAATLCIVAGASLPALGQGVPPAALPPYFDLGIDVTKLPTNPVEARRYYASQSPETQQVLLASCRNYLAHPIDAQMPETLLFCSAIVGGLG